MKILKNITFVMLLLSTISIFAQLDLSFKAEKLGENINSEYEECAPVISPDGSKLYFVRINHPENRFGSKGSQDIWVSEKVEGKWGPATRLPNEVNLGRYNAIYGILPTGELLINGVYDKKGDFLERGVSKVEHVGDSYSKPKALRIRKYAKMSDGKVANISVDISGTLMFLSFSKRNNSKNHIYVSVLKKDKWGKPSKLKNLNSNKSEEAPFLAPNGTTLYFSSNKAKSKENHDIYHCEIEDVNEYRKWTDPVEVLGDVKTDNFESFFILDPTGEYAYFTSKREGDKSTEIYKLKVKDIRDYVLVKGFVVNNESKMYLTPKTEFGIKVTTAGTIGQPREVALNNLKIVSDSVYFEFELPFGFEYIMTAKVEDYEELPIQIDLKSITNYQEFLKDARVKPIPILNLSGKVNFKDAENTNYDSLKIYVNGEHFKEAKINSDGTYSLDLPTGKKYVVEAKKKDFVSFPVDVDVSKENSKVKKTVDLLVEKMPDTYGFLSAKVTSKKDSTFLEPSIYEVLVNGRLASDDIMIKNKEGFELKLELGKKHFIMVKSSNFIEAHDSVDFRKAKKKEIVKSDFVLIPIEVGATVEIKNIYFDLGKATLKVESFVELNRLVDLLKEHDHLKIEVSGHTDSKGNAYLNQKLSGDRALAVKNYLIEQGISVDRLESKGYGFSKPVSTNDTEANRAKNRRVEFTILSND